MNDTEGDSKDIEEEFLGRFAGMKKAYQIKKAKKNDIEATKKSYKAKIQRIERSFCKFFNMSLLLVRIVIYS